jgi:RimJ/RimL family protein N-acetyltransferase
MRRINGDGVNDMKRAVIVGEKIYFRVIEREDIDSGWLDWINDFEINANLSGHFPVSREELENYYKNSQPPNAAMFAVCDKSDDTYIGNARLSSFDWINRTAAYGRMLGRAEYHGRGIGTEMLVLLARYAFSRLNLHRIYTGVVSTNEASIRSNEKAGATQEGVQRNHSYVQGEYRDVVMMGILREEFEARYGKK